MTLCNEINARKVHGERNVFKIRVVKAFQSVNDSSHPNSLTTSTADRLRASYRRLKIARELEQQKRSNSIRTRRPVHNAPLPPKDSTAMTSS
ncbi:hypothetical protein GCK32_019954 [Trichostrongylus colubriformis]|uniref:Uncharacterized protein n=1 Tax=Trichostrongylus colubriformis TaxID=6319 RepID=A0AAN8IQN2_TRICO